MHSPTKRIPRMEIADALLGCFDFACTKHIMSLLDDPVDVVRAAAVSHNLRKYVIENSLCKMLYLKRFPGVTHLAYEANGSYQIIKLSNVLSGDAAEWGTLEREHTIYSYLLQPRLKRMDCPRDCLLFPVGASSTRSKAENMLTSVTPLCTYPVGFSFLSSEGQFETRLDFLKCLEPDICVSIMMNFLDDADIVRLSAVSRFWHQFTIANNLVKQLCVKAIPQLSRIAGVVIGNAATTSSAEAGTSTEFSKREHMVYVSLLRAIKNPMASQSCIEYAICASSTDNFPSESINNTLFRSTKYWSSKGQHNPDVPETLTYKLRSGLWLMTAIDIQPLAASYEPGSPIYSAKYVRFRMGYPKSETVISSVLSSFPLANPIEEDEFEWTYTSPEFPVKQDLVLEPFKLPKPALCKDGYLQVELMGRVGRKATDGLFYIGMTRVRVLGRPLSPEFDTEIHEPSGGILLRYCPESLSSIMQNSVVSEEIMVVPHVVPRVVPRVMPRVMPRVGPHDIPHVVRCVVPHHMPRVVPHDMPLVFPRIVPRVMPRVGPHIGGFAELVALSGAFQSESEFQERW